MPRDNGEDEIMGTVAVIHPNEISIRKSQGEGQVRPQIVKSYSLLSQKDGRRR